MNKKYENFFVFILLFLTITYILLITEWDQYSNMISEMQGFKKNYFKNKENNFSTKFFVVFTLVYIIFAAFLYYFVIIQKKSLVYGFTIIVFLAFIWDLALFTMFDFSPVYLITLLYDMFIVCGCVMLLSHYLYNNYYNVLKKFLPLLFVTYFLSMGWFFYKCYLYNPDLSNIKGLAIF